MRRKGCNADLICARIPLLPRHCIHQGCVLMSVLAGLSAADEAERIPPLACTGCFVGPAADQLSVASHEHRDRSALPMAEAKLDINLMTMLQTSQQLTIAGFMLQYGAAAAFPRIGKPVMP